MRRSLNINSIKSIVPRNFYKWRLCAHRAFARHQQQLGKFSFSKSAIFAFSQSHNVDTIENPGVSNSINSIWKSAMCVHSHRARASAAGREDAPQQHTPHKSYTSLPEPSRAEPHTHVSSSEHSNFPRTDFYPSSRGVDRRKRAKEKKRNEMEEKKKKRSRIQ